MVVAVHAVSTHMLVAVFFSFVVVHLCDIVDVQTVHMRARRGILMLRLVPALLALLAPHPQTVINLLVAAKREILAEHPHPEDSTVECH